MKRIGMMLLMVVLLLNLCACGLSQADTDPVKPDSGAESEAAAVSSEETDSTPPAAEETDSTPPVAEETGEAEGLGIAGEPGEAQPVPTAEQSQEQDASSEPKLVTEVKYVAAKDGGVRVYEGRTALLVVRVLPVDATDKSLTWESANSSIAEVDNEGRVTGISVGSTMVTAKANDGSGKSCAIYIIVEPAVPVTVSGFRFGISEDEQAQVDELVEEGDVEDPDALETDNNVFVLELKNHCNMLPITNINFDLNLYTFDGKKLMASKNYNLGEDIWLEPGETEKSIRIIEGVSDSWRLDLTITSVRFSDDSTYMIPEELRTKVEVQRIHW